MVPIKGPRAIVRLEGVINIRWHELGVLESLWLGLRTCQMDLS